jgi:Plavaka transposase
VPDCIQDFYQEQYNTAATATTLTYCNRELIQAILSLLINDRFVDAYQHGLVLECGDGHTRRLFPRILLYSADYLEKCVHSDRALVSQY